MTTHEAAAHCTGSAASAQTSDRELHTSQLPKGDQ